MFVILRCRMTVSELQSSRWFRLLLRMKRCSFNISVKPRPPRIHPLMDGKRVLFGNDIRKHSYDLKYQNRRGDYLKAWWDVVNWTKISDRYAEAKKCTLTI